MTRAGFGAGVASGGLDAATAELIDGQVQDLPPQGVEHDLATELLAQGVSQALQEQHGDAYLVLRHTCLAIGSRSVMRPDIAVVPRPGGQWFRGGCNLADPVLVVEVAHTTRRRDLGRKAAAYAAAGIGDYWVLDMVLERLVTHRIPRPSGGYGVVTPLPLQTEVNALGVCVRPWDALIS